MSNLRHRYNAIAYAILLKAIYSNPLTIADMVEETGLAEHTIRKFMDSLHDQKMVYIYGWAMDNAGRRTLKLWKWGPHRKDAVFEKKSAADMTRTSRTNVLARWNSANPHMKCESYWDLQRLKKELHAQR